MSNTLRCKHRQDEKHHPKCFDNGKPKESVNTPKVPKILLLDIETAPMEVYVWGLGGNDYISPTNIIKDWFVLSWSAKWLFSPNVTSLVVTPEEAVNRDDSRIIAVLWELLNEADITITHNGNKFDLPKINTRFLLHGFPPPSQYRTIDTLLVARRVFRFSSNKLDYLNKSLGLNLKDDMKFSDWVSCVHGNKKSLEKMQKYNAGDVLNLEELYVVLRPWIDNHPNIAMYVDTVEHCCRNCGSYDLNWGGFYRTNVSVYKAFRCKCGAIGRDKIRVTKSKQGEIYGER